MTAQLTNKYGEWEAAEHQDQIDWTNIMLGRMTPEWAVAQEYYYGWLGRRKIGRKWLVAIMVKLLNLSSDMWDHQNKNLHLSVHPWKLVTVRRADLQIDEEYERGYINLMKKDYKWLKQPPQTWLPPYFWTLVFLQGYNIVHPNNAFSGCGWLDCSIEGESKVYSPYFLSFIHFLGCFPKEHLHQPRFDGFVFNLNAECFETNCHHLL